MAVDCVKSIKNEQRVIALERDMGRIQKWIVGLVIASFSTLCSALIALVVVLLQMKTNGG